MTLTDRDTAGGSYGRFAREALDDSLAQESLVRLGTQAQAASDAVPSARIHLTMSSTSHSPVRDGARSAGREAGVTQAGGTPPANSPVGGRLKRVLDIGIAGSALLVSSPLLLFVVLLCAMTSGRPILYGHERAGFGRRTFQCYKFRTMVRNGDAVLRAHLERNPDAKQEWDATQKLRNDPRLTWIGGLIRKSSIDELPQLINVLRGDMSCVGPRPVPLDELDNRYGLAAHYYARARPGLSGKWQVSGRNSVEYADRVALDVDYVRNWSLMGDLKILVQTVPALFRHEETS